MKTFLSLLGVLLVVALLVFILPSGCTSESTARRVLDEQGYTQVEITGWRPFMKSKYDFYSTGFKAVSPSGKVVTGAVTSGFFKGSTIRFD